jgi:nitrogen-specific signal transduction histidine kinase
LIHRSQDEVGLPPPPYLGLGARLERVAAEVAARAPEAAEALRAEVSDWEVEQRAWDERIARFLSVHHDINNALVGVRGNAQLLLMGPLSEQPAIRDKLEVVIRESTRIKEAASMLRALKNAFGGNGTTSRAA